MRAAIILTIFRKEILETLRDRRTLFFSFLLPILLYPVLSLSLAKVQETRVAEQQAKVSRVALWGAAPAGLQDWLRKTNVMVRLEPGRDLAAAVERELATGKPPPETAKRKRGEIVAEPVIEPEPSPVRVAAQQWVLERKVDAVLVMWPDFAKDLETGGRAALSIYYDSVREDSRKAHERLHEALMDFRREEVRRRERERGLPEGFATAIAVRGENVSQPKREVGSIIGSLLPLLLIILSASGGIYVTLDLTAGEKERNTMQTLLCAPLDPVEIIGGKFLAAWAVVLLSALANVASLAATFARIAAPVSEFNIPPLTYLLTFFALLPVTFTTTAVFLGVAVFARDLKDGQNFLTPVMLAITLPLAVTSLPGIELTAATSFVPMVNIALLMKGLFIGEAKPELVFLTLASASVYALVALLLAARVFHRQHVLLGGSESVREWIKRPVQAGGTPTPTFVLATFGSVFVVMFYGSLLLSQKHLAATILVSQYGFFLLPVLLLAVFMRFAPEQTFALRRPGLRAVVGSVLVGLSAWAVAGGLVIRLLPPPDSMVKAMEKMLLLGDGTTPLWAVWLLFAISPGLCEEMFFRGLVLSGLRRWGCWRAIGVSALLFGIAHASLYRLLPTLFLGIVFGYLVWRSGSIVCSMIAHALNNGFITTVVHLQPREGVDRIAEMTVLPWSLTLAGVAVCALGLWLVHTAARGREVTGVAGAAGA